MTVLRGRCGQRRTPSRPLPPWCPACMCSCRTPKTHTTLLAAAAGWRRPTGPPSPSLTSVAPDGVTAAARPRAHTHKTGGAHPGDAAAADTRHAHGPIPAVHAHARGPLIPVLATREAPLPSTAQCACGSHPAHCGLRCVPCSPTTKQDQEYQARYDTAPQSHPMIETIRATASWRRPHDVTPYMLSQQLQHREQHVLTQTRAQATAQPAPPRLWGCLFTTTPSQHITPPPKATPCTAIPPFTLWPRSFPLTPRPLTTSRAPLPSRATPPTPSVHRVRHLQRISHVACAVNPYDVHAAHHARHAGA